MSAEKNKEIVRKVNEAFSNNDMEAFISYCAEDVKWHMNTTTATGKDGIREALEKIPFDLPPVITIKHIIADESGAACTGTIKMQSSGGDVSNALFCDVYKMEDGRINELSSYIVDIKDDQK
jgi:ketosteroid isomerase-like protein